jgi:hypothetical protein
MPHTAIHLADGDADAVEAAGRGDEADAVGEPALTGRQLGAVRVAVEDREEADQNGRHDERRLGRARHHHAEQNGRQRHGDLHARERDADQAEETAEGHDHRERHRQQPDRRLPQLGAPHADADHRQHVIQAGHRMTHTRHEALRLALLRVRHRGARRGENEQRCRQDLARETAQPTSRRHRSAPRNTSVRWIVQYAPSEPTA